MEKGKQALLYSQIHNLSKNPKKIHILAKIKQDHASARLKYLSRKLATCPPEIADSINYLVSVQTIAISLLFEKAAKKLQTNTTSRPANSLTLNKDVWPDSLARNFSP